MNLIQRIIGIDSAWRKEQKAKQSASLHRKKVQAESLRRQQALAVQSLSTFDVLFTNKTGADLLKRIKSGNEDAISDAEYDRLPDELKELWEKSVQRRHRELDEEQMIAEDMSFFQYAVWGLTPRDIRLNRRRAEAKKKKEEIDEWNATHEWEIDVERAELAHRIPWWRYEDSVDAEIRRESVRNARKWVRTRERNFDRVDWDWGRYE